MRDYDEALGLFGDEALSSGWRGQLGSIVEDEQATPVIAGFSLRRLHDLHAWEPAPISAAFSLRMSGPPQPAGSFLEGFLSGSSEVILQDEALLRLVDDWLCELTEEDFVESLPLLRRSMSGFDAVSRRRLMEMVKQVRGKETQSSTAFDLEENPAFTAALPLLYKILGIEIGGER